MSAALADPRSFLDGVALRSDLGIGMRSVEQVVEAYIEQLDRLHPALNAATQIFHDEARAKATYTDTGVLGGLPISVKETLGITGTTVTAGSARMPEWRVEDDAAVVQRLREAGAIILARGNLSEFGMVHEADNLVFGRTNNPLNPERSPGGSSGGDAALVASGSVVFGIGTDIGGSIRYPAHCCGVVGFKPASEAVDKTRTWPPEREETFSDSMLAIGPITRSVRDARLVYEVIADDGLPRTERTTSTRLVVPDDFAMKTREAVIDRAYERAQAGLVDAGLEQERRSVPDAAQAFRNYITVLIDDYEQPIRKGLTTEDGKTFSISREGFRHLTGRPTVHKYLYRLLALMPLVRPSAATAAHAREEIRETRAAIRDVLGTDGVLLVPANGALAMPHGDAAAYMARPGVRSLFTPTIYANVLNLPAITVPAWTDRDPETGLVPGIMLCSAPGAEARLLDAAEALEGAVNPVAAPSD